MMQVMGLGWRVYLPVIVVIVFVVRAVRRRIWPKPNKKPVSLTKVVIATLGKIIVVGSTLIPVIVFPPYTAQQPIGPYQVATSTYTLEDMSRKDPFAKTGINRKVNAQLWYPQNAQGKYPLVVFDHGAYGVRKSNESVYLELASQGYVVCAIDHPGHSFYTKLEDGTGVMIDKGYLQEVNDLNVPGKYTHAQAFEVIQKWMTLRSDDINFTINTLLERSQLEDAPLSYQLIDSEKIGLFGHSMGAAASVQVSRMRPDIDAVVNIDGPCFSEIAYDSKTDTIYAKKDAYPIPILNIYSDQVWRQLKDGTRTGVYAANKQSGQMCTQSFELYIKGSKHLTLTDLAMISPLLTNWLQGEKAAIDLKQCRQEENAAIVKFFNCYLKEGEAYQ